MNEIADYTSYVEYCEETEQKFLSFEDWHDANILATEIARSDAWDYAQYGM